MRSVSARKLNLNLNLNPCRFSFGTYFNAFLLACLALRVGVLGCFQGPSDIVMA